MTDPDQPFDNKALTERVDLNFALQAAGMGVWEVDPTTNQVQWDERCGELFGISKSHQFLYQDTLQYIHPDDVHQVNQAVQQAMKFESGGSYSATYRTIGEDGRTRWIRSTGRSYFNQMGQAVRFAGVAQEVTELTLAHQQVEKSEARFRSFIDEAPIAICLFVGPQMRIEIANPAMIAVWGKGTNVLGKTLLEALPELKEQHFPALLDELFITGNGYSSKGGRADLVIDGELRTFYFDYDFKPLRDPDGRVYAILETATDVTAQVLAQKQMAETATALQNAVELAQLGQFRLDIATSLITLSPRVADWYGFDHLVTDVESFIASASKSDREQIRSSLFNTLLPDSGGRSSVVYSVIHAKSGHQRILHALGQVYRDATGQAIRIEGVAQDITSQRALQMVLEQQVQERTEELAASNEELASTTEELAANNEELEANNEELAAINEELEEANSQLNRSNDNLQKFAYVASHDLQEPLRKIQQFGDLLKNQYRDQLGEGGLYLDRMQSAANRMSTLIKDLLNYSRLSSQRDSLQPVSLARVVAMVLSDLELVIADTGAHLEVGVLPTVTGDAVQLGQLFQNLLSNALKFHQPGVAPQISITVHTVMAQELPPSLKPSRASRAYYRIDVADQGVGFNEKYIDRIFQVFQRLHGKSEFAGTGIGLAICERVVANHGGAITASSQPGQGATFSVYLPG